MSANEGKKDYSFLIVDDQRQMLMYLGGMLKAGGYKKYACARSARQALSIVKTYPVDFVISDWNMPNMTGVEFLRIIRGNPAYCDLPFVMVTAEMTREKVIYAIEEGVDGYLIKPISQDKLLSTIRRILDKKPDPDSTQRRISKLNTLKLQEKYDEAITFGQQILEKHEDPIVFLVLSECYLHKKDYKNAIEYSQRVLKIKRDSRPLHLLGKICIAQKKYEEAIEYFKQASEINPLDLSRKIEVGNVYLKLGLVNEAAETFESVCETEVTDLNRVDIGAAYLSFGDVKKAGEYLDKAADPIPETVSVFNKYAIELRKMGEYEESLKQYKRCVEIEPGSYILHYNLGRVCFEMEEYGEAQKAFEDSLRLKPDDENVKKLLDYVKSETSMESGTSSQH